MNKKLYTMKTQDIKTGEETVMYGHATINVMHDFLEAYLSETTRVIIEEYLPIEHMEDL